MMPSPTSYRRSSSMTRNKWVARSLCTNSLLRQPEVVRQDPGLTESVSRAQVDDVLAGSEGRRVDRDRLSVAQRLPLGVPPQVVHRVQLRRRPGQQADFDAQLLGPLQAVRCRVLPGPVLAQNDV